MIEENLFRVKYRPKKMKSMVLLPRIRQSVTIPETDEPILPDNLILYGPAGMGKTTLARILIEGHDAFVVDGSYNSSVDVLREDINDFCRSYNVMSDDTSGKKIVYIEEFDGVSTAYQEALRGFIEKNENRVRFIATCNNISKISDPILSRFTAINFEPTTLEEATYLKERYKKRLMQISEREGINATDVECDNIVANNFPDLRKAMNVLQMKRYLPTIDSKLLGSDTELFQFILSKKQPNETFDYVLTGWGNRVPELIRMLGRPFATWITENNPSHVKSLAEIMPIVVEYDSMLRDTYDPVILACALIYKIQKEIK